MDIEGLLFFNVRLVGDQIPQQEQADMFDEFDTTDKRGKENFKQKRLGLHISKQVCMKLNGDLSF